MPQPYESDMNFLRRAFQTYRDKNGWINVKTPEVEVLNSSIYFDYKRFSDLCEYASSKKLWN